MSKLDYNAKYSKAFLWPAGYVQELYKLIRILHHVIK